MAVSDSSILSKTTSLPTFWQSFIATQSKQTYFIEMIKEIAKQRSEGIEIYPKNEDVFNALHYSDIAQLRVVILGQDPYHGANQAQGLAFSVNKNQKIPPSLVNIYKELAQDIEGFEIPQHGELKQWAEQGVLLLNTVLTVQQAKAHSHAKLGWETFTDNMISAINEHSPHCVFMLWGAHAQQKGKSIDKNKHLVLEAVHPSPLSAYRGFLGCKHFSQANRWLIEHKLAPIVWNIEDDELTKTQSLF